MWSQLLSFQSENPSLKSQGREHPSYADHGNPCRITSQEDDHWGIVDSSITGWLLEVKVVWSRSSQEGCISPLCLPPRSCFNQEFWEGAAAKALGVPSDVLKLKYCILESIQTEIWIVPKHLQNGKKRITLFCFLFLTEVPNSAVSVNFLVRF